VTGSLVRIAALSIASIASAIGVWKVHGVIRGPLGPVGAILGAMVAALMLGSLLWIVTALLPKGRAKRKPEPETTREVRR
jgi:hypothetical protein